MSKETKGRSDCPAPTDAEKSHETVLNPEVCEAIKDLRPEQRNVVIQAIKQESFSGPIPRPELLQKYDEVQHGFAERIVSMAERQFDHRISCEDKVVAGSVAESKRGQNYGLIVALSFLAAAVFLGYFGHDWLAGCLGCSTLVALVTVFVTNKPHKHDDKNENNPPS